MGESCWRKKSSMVVLTCFLVLACMENESCFYQFQCCFKCWSSDNVSSHANEQFQGDTSWQNSFCFFVEVHVHMNTVQRTPRICKVTPSKVGSKNECHFCKLKLCTRAYNEKYNLNYLLLIGGRQLLAFYFLLWPLSCYFDTIFLLYVWHFDNETLLRFGDSF